MDSLHFTPACLLLGLNLAPYASPSIEHAYLDLLSLAFSTCREVEKREREITPGKLCTGPKSSLA